MGKAADSRGDLGGGVASVGVLGNECQSKTRDVGGGHGSSANGVYASVAVLDPGAGDVTTGGEEIESCLFSLSLGLSK